MNIREHLTNDISFLTLTSKTGISLTVSEMGASIRHIDFKGAPMTVEPQDEGIFMSSIMCYGKTLGRLAGHEQAVFSYLGKEVRLPSFDGAISVHGGRESLAFKRFSSKIRNRDDGQEVIFSYLSPNGEQGLMGSVSLTVSYFLSDLEPLIRVTYSAKADEATPFNPSNHTYFNLGGEETVLGHELKVSASSFVETDERQLTKGIREIESGSYLDFRNWRPLKETVERAKAACPKLGGLDHLLVFEKGKRSVSLKNHSYSLRITTSFPSVQLYADNSPDSSLILSNGNERKRHSSLAIEPQYVPSFYREMALIPHKKRVDWIEYRFKTSF